MSLSEQQMQRRYETSDTHEMIPRVLLRAMAGLVVAVLALTTFAVISDRPHEARVHTGEPVQTMLIEIKEGPGGVATVHAMDGTLLAESNRNTSGFIAVVANALRFERGRSGVTGNPPVTLIRFADGRLGLRDDATGWKIHLTGFGQDNQRAFAAILAQ